MQNTESSEPEEHIPKVSIILPTFNRARFIPQALASILQQEFRDWELIIVDDGSTDESASTIENLSRRITNSIVYLKQNNQGPAAARNLGIRKARGKYLAFFDSDDTWDTFHLSACISQLERNVDIDWIYSSFRRVRALSEETIDVDVFREGGRSAEFLSLKASKRGELHVIEDANAMRCAIVHGMGIGLRTSVVRRSVFQEVEFPPFRIGEDQVLYLRLLANGVKFGYLTSVQATAYVHDSNISEVAGFKSIDRYVRTLSELIRALESMRDLDLSSGERRDLEHRIANECFWNLGYNCLRSGRNRDAFKFLSKGLRLHPGNLHFWKTYVLALLKIATRKTRLLFRVSVGDP